MNITRYKYPIFYLEDQTLGYSYTNTENAQKVYIQMAKEQAVQAERLDILAEISYIYEGIDLYENEVDQEYIDTIFLRQP
jgi:hypothetical protein